MELNVLELPRLTRGERIWQNFTQTVRRVGSWWIKLFALCVAIGLGTLGTSLLVFAVKFQHAVLCNNTGSSNSSL